MKHVGSLLLCGIILLSLNGKSQSVGIGIDAPSDKAILDISSTSKGVLISRMTSTDRNNITGLNGTHEGLLIYNTSDSEFNYWDGSQWIPFPGGDDDWYEFGTPPVAPDDINDDIYTNGKVGIGQIPTQSLHIDNSSVAIQSILVEDLSQTGNAYNPSTASIAQNNRASVFVDKTTGIMYSEDANRAFWRLDGNSNVVNAGYSGSCPNLITSSMNASGYEYLGTNDNTDFIVATNDRERLRVLRDGQLVAYGKGIATPASSPTGCVPAYPVIDAASFYGTDNTYPLNAYSEDVPAVYGAAQGTGIPAGVAGEINYTGYGVWGYVDLGASGGSYGVFGEETTLAGWAVFADGDVGSTGTYYLVSDAALKEDVKEYNGGLNAVMQLQPSTYSFKEQYWDYGMPRDNRVGFIAQEVQEIFPHLVRNTVVPGPHGPKGSPDSSLKDIEGIKALDYTGLIPVLTNAIQEQQGIIELQQDQIEELKASNDRILARLQALER